MQWNLNQIKMCGASSLIPSLLVNCTFKAVWQSPPTSVVNCPWKALRGVDNKIFTWIYNFQFTGTRLLRFSKTRELWSSKAPFTIKFFSVIGIIIPITSNEHWITEIHKTDRDPPITNQKTWPFEPIEVNFRFLRGPLRLLTAAKKANVSRVYDKRSDRLYCKKVLLRVVVRENRAKC